MKNINYIQKDCIILDFDGTIFWNPTHNFSINIEPYNIIEGERFYSQILRQTDIQLSNNTDVILITGRAKYQKPIILEILKGKGYYFSEAYFRIFNTSLFPINEKDFFRYYRIGKVNLITQI